VQHCDNLLRFYVFESRWYLLLKQEAFENVRPIRHCEPPHALILHRHSPGVATIARRLRIDVHDNDNDTFIMFYFYYIDVQLSHLNKDYLLTYAVSELSSLPCNKPFLSSCFFYSYYSSVSK